MGEAWRWCASHIVVGGGGGGRLEMVCLSYRSGWVGEAWRLRYITYSYLRKKNIHKELPGQCRNWAAEVRKLLIDIGREYVWDNNAPVNGDLISYAKQTLVVYS